MLTITDIEKDGWKSGINQVINCDCLQLMKLMPDGCVDLVLTDPPYNQGCHYASYTDNLSEDEYKQMLCDCFMNRKCVVISYPEETINYLSYVGNCEEVVSWVYNSNTAKQHRLITWWNCKPDFTKIGQEYKNPTDKRIAKRISEGKQAKLYDWWEINQVKNVSKDFDHPCPIPIEIARRIILLTTNKGDTILDPFAGSFTTAIACKELKRNFICCDIEKKYCEIGEKRLLNVTEGLF